jgi:ribosomal protein S18 acetylase RimI-like enzyme
MVSGRQDINIREIRAEDARLIAGLHIQGIGTGLISSLGLDFVAALYAAVAESESGFGFVAEDGAEVVGFAAFATSVRRLYKSVIMKTGARFAMHLSSKMFSLKRMKRILETLLYPRRTAKMDLPEAELISIVVCPSAGGKGLGTRLIYKGLAECKRRGIQEVKVLVGADNKAANRLYLRCSFELVTQTQSHGIPSNIYVVRTDRTSVQAR